MRSANPTLTEKVFINQKTAEGANTMTIAGTVNKTVILLFLLTFPATLVWNQFFAGANVMIYLAGGAIGGLVFALITVFKKSAAPVTAPIYAILEGAFLGGFSAMMESIFPGIVLQAVALTLGTLLSLLLAYKSGWIKVTQNFRLGVAAATGGIFLIYGITFIMGLFGSSVPYIHESGAIGIGFSLFVVVIASLNLVLDFDFIEKGEEVGAPKYMEWYAAFGLMVTLIWLYIEFLRLLAKLRSR